MRIADNMRLTGALTNEARSSEQLYNLTDEASSGLRVNQPSDDPAGYASVVTINSRIAVLKARSSAVSAATDDLTTADGTLGSASDLLVQAKQVALTAANATSDAGSRASAATQVTEMVQQMIGLANTKGTNGYIFGGTKNDTPPFDATTGAFQGNDNPTQIEVADGVLANTSVSGAKAFTAAGGRDVIGDLQSLATALTGNNTTGIQAAIGNLDSDNDQVIDARVTAGAASERLQSSATVMSNALTAEQTSLANEADVDFPTVYSKLTAVQTSYQNALSINRQILSMFQTANG